MRYKNVKKQKRIFEKILGNASSIQYFQNIIDSSERYSFEINEHDVYELVDGEEVFLSHEKHYYLCYEQIDNDGELYQGFQEFDEEWLWLFNFLLKGRKLKSGLATPMARYYAYKAVDKLEYEETPIRKKRVNRNLKGQPA